MGPAGLSDAELLALLLRTGTRGHDVLSLAEGLLAEAGSLASLAGWGAADLRRHKGMGRIKAMELSVAMELARRIALSRLGDRPQLSSGRLVAEFLGAAALGLEVEKLWVLCLNRKLRLIRCVEVTSGTATSALAHPREVFRTAIREAAASIVCAHNHPSGDPSPSAADVDITRLLREASKVVEIDLRDHVIVGKPAADPCGRGYYSFRESGLI